MQFSLPRVDGGTLAFDNRSGEPIMLDFFATWCGPCNREMPDVLRLAHAYRERGLRVELIDVREKTAAVQAFVKRYGIDVPVALDADGTTFKHFLGLQAIPTAAFYTAKGILTCMETQELTWKELDNEASAALNGWMP